VATGADAQTDSAEASLDGPAADVQKDDVVSSDATIDAVEVDVGPTDALFESEPGCVPVTQEVPPEADGMIAQGACNGANSYLNGPFGNIGVGRGLLRFSLPDSILYALDKAGHVKKVRLVLPRNQNCEGEVNPCPASPGNLSAFALRSDWDEGVAGQDYSGADWCRRAAGNPGPEWDLPGADGEEDHGPLAAKIAIDNPLHSAEFDLDMSVVTQWRQGTKVSVLIVPTDGAVYCFATRESVQWPRPRLEVEFCP